MPPSIASLGHTYRSTPPARWQLISSECECAANSAAAYISNPQNIAQEQLLKAAERRLVIALPAAATMPELVIKAFPLSGLRKRLLRSSKYGYAEAAHLERAARLGAPVPKLYGFGTYGNPLHLWSAVIMERVAGQDFLTLLNTAQTAEDQEAALQRCVDLFLSLYRAGVNHIDLRPDALFFGTDPGQDRIIDFQYCSFRTSPSVQTLVAQAGYFARWWRASDVATDKQTHWFELLLATANIPAAEFETLEKVYQSYRDRVVSIQDRLDQ